MSKPPLRILELGMHFDPACGGADRYFDGLLLGMESLSVDFTAAAFGKPKRHSVVALDDWSTQTSSRICLGPENLTLWRRWTALHKLGYRFSSSSDVVATHFSLYALPLIGQLKNVSHVAHFHGPWARESASEGQGRLVVAVKKMIERRVYLSAKRLIALSQAFRETLIKEYAIPPEKIAVVPGGVDTAHFHPVEQQTARRQMGWPKHKKIIFCLRRMVRRMGLETLLAAFAEVAIEHPDAILILGGKGPLTGELQRFANESSLGGRVIFQGFISDHDLPSAYSAADFSIVPSQALEGFGLITLESLACGTPVLVTPVGGLPETVKALDSTLILAGHEVQDIMDGLRRGLSSPLPSRILCRDYAEKHFSWTEIARRVNDVYQEAANDNFR